MHFPLFLVKRFLKGVLLQQDTIAKVFLTRYKKTNIGPNPNRKENILRPLNKNFLGQKICLKC